MLITDDSGQGYLVIVDYSAAPNHLIDAGGVRFAYAFLAENLAAVVPASNSTYSGPPLFLKGRRTRVLLLVKLPPSVSQPRVQH